VGAAITTLTNTGNGPLNITSMRLVGDFAQTSNCGATLSAGVACVFSITFTPTAPGTRTGTLAVIDNASGSPHLLALSGNGVGGFQLSAGSNSAVVIRGTDSINFTVSASGASGFWGSISLDCLGNTPANCSFSPGSILVGQTSTLTVSNLNAVTGNSLTLVVTGTSGQQMASLSLSVSLADFSLSVSPAQLSASAGLTSTVLS